MRSSCSTIVTDRGCQRDKSSVCLYVLVRVWLDLGLAQGRGEAVVVVSVVAVAGVARGKV
jgi:hypothetical protein